MATPKLTKNRTIPLYSFPNPLFLY